MEEVDLRTTTHRLKITYMLDNHATHYPGSLWNGLALRKARRMTWGRCKTTRKVLIICTNSRSWIDTVNRTKNFWFPSPTQLLTQGQWWSIFRIHRWQTEQWCARSGFILQHLGHLKMTWPSLKPICWMFSLVALPRGTAPWKEFVVFARSIQPKYYTISYRITQHSS